MKKLITASALALSLHGLAAAEMNSPRAERHVLSLNDVDITALIDDVSIITGYTFILHPDVRRTKVTVMSQAPMDTAEVFQVFLAPLRVHGFAAVPAGKGVYRIVPEQMAIGDASVRGTGPNAFITQVFKLNNFSAIEAAQMVKPLIDAQGQVVANARSNTLVLVDYSSNMPRLREIVQGLDENDRTKVETVELRNVPAREIEGILTDLLSDRDANPNNRFEVSAATTSNSIVLKGDEATVARAIRVAQELDQTDPVRDSLRVIEMRNSNAEDIVPILERLAETMAEQASPGDSQVPGATIAHHQPTNSLVISASPDTILAMERVVEALDKRRAQVLVEAIIVEMSDDTARSLGVQFLLSGTGESSVPFLSTNFSREAPNLLEIAGAIVDPDVFGGTNPFTTSAVTSLVGQQGIGVGGGDNLGGAQVAAGLIGGQTCRYIGPIGKRVGQNPGIFKRHIGALGHERKRRMRGIPQQCRVVIMPTRCHRMAIQPPDLHAVDTGQQRLDLGRELAERGAQIGGIIGVGPAFGGPFIALLYGDDVHQPPVAQGIAHKVAARPHVDGWHRIAFGLGRHARPPGDLPREKRLGSPVLIMTHDRINAIRTDQ